MVAIVIFNYFVGVFTIFLNANSSDIQLLYKKWIKNIHQAHSFNQSNTIAMQILFTKYWNSLVDRFILFIASF